MLQSVRPFVAVITDKWRSSDMRFNDSGDEFWNKYVSCEVGQVRPTTSRDRRHRAQSKLTTIIALSNGEL